MTGLVEQSQRPSPEGETASEEMRGNWWTRPCGGREVWWLALPLIVSTGSWSIMHYVDRVFLSWHSSDAMAAAMPAGLLHFLLLCIPLGTAGYVNTFVAQYTGAGKPGRVGMAVGQGLRIGFFAAPFYLALIPFASWIFHFAGHDPDLIPLETIYFQVAAWGAGPAIMSESLTAYFTGRGRTRPVMLINLAAVGVNGVLDYLMIFGHGGFPEMGIAGAAWATVGSQWFRVLAYFVWMRLDAANWRRHEVTRGIWHFEPRLFRRIVRYGGPSGMQIFVEVAGFTLLVLLVGRLGKLEMAATTLAFTVNSLAFLPLLGLSIAVATLVGQQVVRGRHDLAERATWSAFVICVPYVAIMGLLYMLVPRLFLMANSLHAPEGFAEIERVTIVLLRFVAVYTVLDAANMIFVSAVKGAGDTRFVMLVSAIMAAIVVGVVWAGIERFGFGLYACWTVLTVWIWLLGIIYWLRFRQGHWRAMRVIEIEHGDGALQAMAAPDTAAVAPTQF